MWMIAGTKRVRRFAVSYVQSANTGTQELTAERGHGIKQRNRFSGLSQAGGSHQPCGTRTNDHCINDHDADSRRCVRPFVSTEETLVLCVDTT
jgi:hypothetical protein